MRHLERSSRAIPGFFNFGREMERLCDQGEGCTSSEDLSNFTPAVDIIENKDSLMLTVEIPGVEKKDVSLSVENNVLTISGEKKNSVEVNEENFSRVERSYGSFHRSFNLSSRIDSEKIEAGFTNGILEVTLPKKEESKPKQIEVKVK